MVFVAIIFLTFAKRFPSNVYKAQNVYWEPLLTAKKKKKRVKDDPKGGLHRQQ